MTLSILMLGTWGPVALTVARSCQKQHIDFYLLSVGKEEKNCFNLTPRATQVAMISPELLGTPEGIKVIAEYAKQIKACALITAFDEHLVWLAENRDSFEPTCKVLVQSAESLIKILSKCNQLEIAKEAGFQILPTFLIMESSDMSKIPDSAFPLVLRPSHPMSDFQHFKIKLIKSKNQLNDFFYGTHKLSAPIIAQPFKSYPNLVVHGVRTTHGEILATKAFFVSRKFEGLALSIQPYTISSQLNQMCQKFVELSGITGCYHFDLLFSPEEHVAYFLEINVRLGGTTDKIWKLGFDEPSLLLQSYDIIPYKPPLAITKNSLIVNKRALLKHIIWASKGKLTEMDYPNVSRFWHIIYSFRDLLFAKDSIFDWRDLRGSFWFHLRK